MCVFYHFFFSGKRGRWKRKKKLRRHGRVAKVNVFTLFFILTPGIITLAMLTNCDWAGKKKDRKKDRTNERTNEHTETRMMMKCLPSCAYVCVSRMLVRVMKHAQHRGELTMYAVVVCSMHSGEGQAEKFK